MKKEYEKPYIKIIKLIFKDIIITSESGSGNSQSLDEKDKNWTPFEPF